MLRPRKTLLFVLAFLLTPMAVNAVPLYGIDTQEDTLFTVATDTGNVAILGGLGVSWGFGGIAFDGANLFGINSDNNLYSIDAVTGTATIVGATGAGGVLESFAIINGVGYSQNVFNNDLYSIDLTTGAATLLGNYTGGRVTGLTSVDGRLFGTRIFEQDLVELDPLTGALIGIVGVHGLSQDTSLAWSDGSFWTIPAFSGTLYSLDPSTGAATLMFSGLGLGHVTALTGLDFGEAQIPEPGTLALLGIGLFGLGMARRRKLV